MSLQKLITQLNNTNQHKFQTLEIEYTKETLNFIHLLIEEGYLLQYVFVDQSVVGEYISTNETPAPVVLNTTTKPKLVLFLKYDSFGNSVFNKIIFLPKYSSKTSSAGTFALGLTHSLILKRGNFFYLVQPGSKRTELERQGVIVAKIL